MAASRTLSELVVVREWLHETAPPPPRPDASTGYWRFTKHRVTQGRWTGNTGRAAENVVREMDPDAVVREAEIGHSLAGDDAVRSGFATCPWSHLPPFLLSFRATTRRFPTRCLRMCARGTSMTRSNFAVMRINRGAQRASVVLFSSHGPQFVRFLCFASYSPQLKPLRCTFSDDTAGRRCGRRRGRRPGLLARKQAAHFVEDFLYARSPRFSPIVRGTCLVCRPRTLHPDLERPKIRMSHVGRLALGDDLNFM